MATEGLDEVFLRYRFNPSPMDAVTYYLPRLISGEPMLHGVERLIHRSDVYGCEPKDLAAKFAPVPQADKSDDRFFFTLCKRQKGSSNRSARGAGAGTWTIQKTTDIKDDAGIKVGEKKSLCFKKGKGTTGWLMEEYRCCLQEAVVAGGEKVMCKIYLSPNASPATRQESAAYARQEEAEPVPAPAPQPERVSTHAPPKRPAPIATDPPCPKRTRVAVPTPPVVQQGRSAVFAEPPPACLQAAFREAPAAAEADDDMDRFACSLDELLGVCGAEEEEQAENDQFVSALEDILGGAEEEEETVPADGEKAEQQVLTSDESAMAPKDDLEEFLERYKREESPPLFRLDQLEGHNEFFSV